MSAHLSATVPATSFVCLGPSPDQADGAAAAPETVRLDQLQVQSASAAESGGSLQCLSGRSRVAQEVLHASASSQPDSSIGKIKDASPESLQLRCLPQSFKGVHPGGVPAGQGAVLPFEGAAECNDSVDWQAVRLAPTSKVRSQQKILPVIGNFVSTSQPCLPRDKISQ